MPRPIDEIAKRHPGIMHGDLYIAEARSRTLRRVTEDEAEILPRILSSQRVLVKPGSNEFWRLVQQGWKIQNPYLGFKKLAQRLEERGADDPRALAAWIGRRKYGKAAFQRMAAAGRRNPSMASDGELVVEVEVPALEGSSISAKKHMDFSGFRPETAKSSIMLYLFSKLPNLKSYKILSRGMFLAGRRLSGHDLRSQIREHLNAEWPKIRREVYG